MDEQEIFEQKIKEILEYLREIRRIRVERAIADARKYMENIDLIKDVRCDTNNRQIIIEGWRSMIIYDGYLYALIHKIDARVIYKSFSYRDVYQYFLEIENDY